MCNASMRAQVINNAIGLTSKLMMDINKGSVAKRFIGKIADAIFANGFPVTTGLMSV